jgi:hypothetical protein
MNALTVLLFVMLQLSDTVIETLWSHRFYRRPPQVARKILAKIPGILDVRVFGRRKMLPAFRSKISDCANPRILLNRMLRMRVLHTKLFPRRLRGGVGVNRGERQSIRGAGLCRGGLCQAIEGCSVRASFGPSRFSVPTLCRAHKVMAYFNFVKS